MPHKHKYQYDFSDDVQDGYISLKDVAKVVGKHEGIEDFQGYCELLEVSARDDDQTIEGFSGATLTLEVAEDCTFLNWLITDINEQGHSVFVQEIPLDTDKIPANANEMVEQLLATLRHDIAVTKTLHQALSP